MVPLGQRRLTVANSTLRQRCANVVVVPTLSYYAIVGPTLAQRWHNVILRKSQIEHLHKYYVHE